MASSLQILCSLLFIAFLGTGCFFFKKNGLISNCGFIEFESKKSIPGTIDGFVFNDKVFKLIIPKGLKEYTVSGMFIHELKFNYSQKIVTIYTPFRKDSSTIHAFGLNQKEFIETCLKRESLKYFILGEYFMHDNLKSSGYFGIYKDPTSNFYVVYENVLRSNIYCYDESIKSIRW